MVKHLEKDHSVQSCCRDNYEILISDMSMWFERCVYMMGIFDVYCTIANGLIQIDYISQFSRVILKKEVLKIFDNN